MADHDFTTSASFEGDPRRAIEFAAMVLASAGFRIRERADERLEVTGPGLHATKQDPLLGASRLVLTVRGRAIDLEADLRGLRILERFLTFFPPGLGLFLAVLLGSILRDQWGLVLATSLGSVAPWAVLSPLIIAWQRKRTRAALETLLANAAQAGR